MPVEDSHAVANAFADTALFEQFQRAATLMATSDLVPTHLRDKKANCFLVLNQAYRWQMDPFAVAQCTFVVHGRLGYEGKLVAAAINCNPEIDKRLNYRYSGEGNERKVVVFGKLVEDDEERTVDLVFKNVATANDLWKKQADQQLAYAGARHWARRHFPEVILGVYTRDELSYARDNQKASAVTAADLIDQAAEGEEIEDAEFSEATTSGEEPESPTPESGDEQDADPAGSTENAEDGPPASEQEPSSCPPSGDGSASSEDAPETPAEELSPDTTEKPETTAQNMETKQAVEKKPSATYSSAAEMIDVLDTCQTPIAVDNSIARMALDDLFPPDKDEVLAAAEKRKAELAK